MGNKLYEEEEVRQIAISLRANAPRKIGQKELLLSEMSSSVDDVYMEGFENGRNDITQHPNTSGDVSINFNVDNTSVVVTAPSGYYDTNISKEVDADPIYDKGFDEGVEKVKTEEARTADDLIFDGHTPKSFNITVPAGYYAEDAKREVDTEYYYDVGYDDGWQEGYDEGYADGYDEGLSQGGGGGIEDIEFAPLIEQANNIQSIIDLNEIDPWISDEFQRRYVFSTNIFGQIGYQFPDIIEYETSDPRSCPITVTFYNYNSRLTAHVVYEISDNAMQEYWYSVVDIPPEESVSESFDSESSRGSDWVIEIIGAYFTYD